MGIRARILVEVRGLGFVIALCAHGRPHHGGGGSRRGRGDAASAHAA